jgi:hypothetical protein
MQQLPYSISPFSRGRKTQASLRTFSPSTFLPNLHFFFRSRAPKISFAPSSLPLRRPPSHQKSAPSQSHASPRSRSGGSSHRILRAALLQIPRSPPGAQELAPDPRRAVQPAAKVQREALVLAGAAGRGLEGLRRALVASCTRGEEVRPRRRRRGRTERKYGAGKRYLGSYWRRVLFLI